MAQAETILQHRIGRLDRKLTAKRIAAASWSGAVYVTLSHDAETGKDCYRVELGPCKGNGCGTQVLASGEID